MNEKQQEVKMLKIKTITVYDKWDRKESFICC